MSAMGESHPPDGPVPDSRPDAPALLPMTSSPPRLLDQVQQQAWARGHPEAMAAAFVDWTRRYILFHGKRHPREMARAEVGRFLEHVAQTEPTALVAIEAARQVLEFLYGEVLCLDLGELPRPRPPRLLDQVRQVLRVRHYALRTEDCYVQWIK